MNFAISVLKDKWLNLAKIEHTNPTDKITNQIDELSKAIELLKNDNSYSHGGGATGGTAAKPSAKRKKPKDIF